MTLGERDTAAQIDHPLAGRQPGGDLLGVRGSRRGQVHRCGPVGVGRPHVRVVGGDVVEFGQQAGDEGIHVHGERRVGGLLPADRCGVALGLPR